MAPFRTIKCGLSILLLMTSTAIAFAQGPRPSYGTDVTLETARKITAGTIAEARKHNWNIAVAIVDNHGFLVYFERMDDTQTAGARIAVEKARTSAMFRRPSAAFEDAIKGGRSAVLGLPGVTPVTGGLPIMREGKVIGGIGVSGVASDQDEQCARAGLATLDND
jgi:glc operon protein GlcG